MKKAMNWNFKKGPAETFSSMVSGGKIMVKPVAKKKGPIVKW